MSMLALAYAVLAVGFYAWAIRSAKPVSSPLGLWVNIEEESAISLAA